jgi:hypothetical protein
MSSPSYPFELASQNPATQDYINNLNQYVHGAKPKQLGIYSTSAWLLFAESAKACGSNLTAGEADQRHRRHLAVLHAAQGDLERLRGRRHCPEAEPRQRLQLQPGQRVQAGRVPAKLLSTRPYGGVEQFGSALLAPERRVGKVGRF